MDHEVLRDVLLYCIRQSQYLCAPIKALVLAKLTYRQLFSANITLKSERDFHRISLTPQHMSKTSINYFTFTSNVKKQKQTNKKGNSKYRRNGQSSLTVCFSLKRPSSRSDSAVGLSSGFSAVIFKIRFDYNRIYSVCFLTF